MFEDVITGYFFTTLIGCLTLTSKELSCSSFENLLNAKHETSNFSIVSIVGNTETILKKDYLKDFKNLSELRIHGGTNDIEQGVFSNFENITEFWCRSCSLSVIKASYFSNSNLRIIEISRSNVTDIEPGAFLKLPFAEECDINRNHIRFIKRGMFENTGFKRLYLSSNGIELIEKGAFFGMENLEHLGLFDNRLTTFDSKLLIGKSTTMTSLSIYANELTEISKDVISSLTNLRIFDASTNLIENIEKDSFKNIKNLKELNLERNKIKEFNPSLDNSNNGITSLYLDYNLISYLSEELLDKMEHLNYILIVNNPWQCACKDRLKIYFSERKISNNFHLSSDNCYAKDNSECIQDLGKSMELIKDFKQEG